MKYHIKYLPETIADRDEIRKYLSQYYKSTINSFFKLFDYRKLVVGDYLVFYMIDENENSVEIHRIFHGTRNIGQHLK